MDEYQRMIHGIQQAIYHAIEPADITAGIPNSTEPFIVYRCLVNKCRYTEKNSFLINTTTPKYMSRSFSQFSLKNCTNFSNKSHKRIRYIADTPLLSCDEVW